MSIERFHIDVSNHAVDRYRERIGPVKGKDDLIFLVRGSTKCPEWLSYQMFAPALRDTVLTKKEAKKRMRRLTAEKKNDKSVFLIDRNTGAVFCLEHGKADKNTLVVVTVMDSKPRLEKIRRLQNG